MVPSPEATEPGSPNLDAGLCPHFGPCGGCDALDRPYERQLVEKREALERCLAEVPGVAPSRIAAVLPDPRPYRYRNKAILPVARSTRGRILAGFYRKGSHRIVDLRRCDIQDPALTAVAVALRRAARGLRVGDEDGPALRHLFLRLGKRTRELMVAFVTRGGLLPEGPALVEAAAAAAANARDAGGRPVRLVSVLRNLNDSPGNRILGRRSLPLRGSAWIEDRLGPWRLRVSLRSFYQVNPRMALRALGIAREVAGSRAAGRVVDAYCGIGALALAFADRAREVVGIEREEAAAADARWNLRANGAEGVRLVEASVEEALPGELPGCDLLLLDPPRAGCSEPVLASILETPPPAVLYLSCGPRSLARDLARLTACYEVESVRPLDFFPHTRHLEVLTSLRRRPGGRG